MINLIKDGDIMSSLQLADVEPISLESYYEALKNTENLLIAMLVTKNSSYTYFARNVAPMRYSVGAAINIYKVNDPVNKEEVLDIIYFEVINNPFFLNEIINIQPSNSPQTISKEEIIINAEFLGSEQDVLRSRELQNKLFAQFDNSSHEIILFGHVRGNLDFFYNVFMDSIILCFFVIFSVILIIVLSLSSKIYTIFVILYCIFFVFYLYFLFKSFC